MIFFVLNIVFALVVWLFYPETSGRTLEEMDTIYMGDNDRLFVIDKHGRLLPGFRSRMDREQDPEMMDASSAPDSESGVSVKISTEHRE